MIFVIGVPLHTVWVVVAAGEVLEIVAKPFTVIEPVAVTGQLPPVVVTVYIVLTLGKTLALLLLRLITDVFGAQLI